MGNHDGSYATMLRHPVASRLFWSQALSGLGDWIGLAGLLVLAHRASGSAVGPAGMLAVQGGAAIVGSVALGAWVDRFDRSRALSATYATSAGALLLPVLVPRMWAVLLAAALIGVQRPLAASLRYAITGSRVDPDLLGTVVAAQKAAADTAIALGLSTGGAVAVLLGPGPSLLLDAGTFLLAAVVCLGLPSDRGEGARGDGPLVGFRLMLDTPRLRWFLGAIVVLAAVSSLPEVLAPSVAGESLWLPAVLAAQAVGTALGGLALGTRRHLEHAGPMLVGLAATAAALLLGAGLVGHPGWLAVANLVLGLALSVGVIGQTGFTRAAPPGRAGAVVAAGITTAMIAEGAGSLLVGLASSRLTPAAGYLAAAVATTAGLVLLWMTRDQERTVTVPDVAPRRAAQVPAPPPLAVPPSATGR